jgi:N-acetylglutamate synthase-like GNAT family acetyltransferase/predicted transcriptional regulator
MRDKLSQLGYLAGATRFRRISEKLHIDGDKIYQESQIDFKASWFSVFFILATTDQPKTILDLAEEIGYSHISVKNVISELTTAQLVTIKTHPTDKRSKHVMLSSKGKKVLVSLQKIWLPFAATLKHLLDLGHPDFLNIITRIEKEISRYPINKKINDLDKLPHVQVLDYKPSLKKDFYGIAGPWLLEVLKGKLEKEDELTLHNPDEAYLLKGGFVFFALHDKKVVGCVALKRLDEDTFEFAKLFVKNQSRNLGIATRLIERCITRCRENGAKQLWLQTTLAMPEAHKLYYKLGFNDKGAPSQLAVLKRTEKVMVMDL